MTPTSPEAQPSASAPPGGLTSAATNDAGANSGEHDGHNGAGTPAARSRAVFFWPQLLCGLLGLGLAVYTIYLHRLIEAGAATGCGISDTISCDKVIGSKPWGEPFGIPLGVYGSAYFVAVLATSFSTGSDRVAAALQSLAVAAVGILFSLGLEYVMWVILRHGCPVCMTTHFVTLVNFCFALAAYLRLRKRRPAGAAA